MVAASGTLGILIPPSIMLVIMADQLSMSRRRPVLGAMIPGLMLGLIYVIYVIVVTRICFPSMAPAAAGRAADDAGRWCSTRCSRWCPAWR